MSKFLNKVLIVFVKECIEYGVFFDVFIDVFDKLFFSWILGYFVDLL